MTTLTEKVQGLDFKATGLADRVSEILSQAIMVIFQTPRKIL